MIWLKIGYCKYLKNYSSSFHHSLRLYMGLIIFSHFIKVKPSIFGQNARYASLPKSFKSQWVNESQGYKYRSRIEMMMGFCPIIMPWFSSDWSGLRLPSNNNDETFWESKPKYHKLSAVFYSKKYLLMLRFQFFVTWLFLINFAQRNLHSLPFSGSLSSPRLCPGCQLT